MLNAGMLGHRVIIQKQQETQSADTGAISVSWVNVATVWSAIEPISAKEFIASEAEASAITARIMIRYRGDITAKMRLYHAAKDKYYNIEGVLSDKGSGLEYLTLPCSEGIRYMRGEPDQVIPDNLIAPAISGTASIGQVLTSSTGTWANNPLTYAYQWYLDDEEIEGQTSSTLIVPDEEDGILTVSVVASNAAGDGDASYSEGVLIIS